MWSALRLAREGMRQKAVLRRPLGQILTIQEQRLRSLVAWAKTRSPFYADRFRHIDPERFELGDLPTLTKAEMMANLDGQFTDRRLRRAELEDFVSDPQRLGQWYLDKYALSRTSGTQGL